MVDGRLGEVLDWLTGPGRRRQWRRFVLRRAIAMACATAAMLGVLTLARTPPGGSLATVVVAARTLAVGTVLTPGAVRLARWPAALVPQGSTTSIASVEGQRLTSALEAGEAVTATRLHGSGLLTGQPAGTLALHLALADGAATSMVRPGDRIDLLAPQGVVARAVLVLGIDGLSTSSTAGGLMGVGGGRPDQDAGVVVGVDESDAKAIASTPPDAMGRPALTLLLRGS